MKTNPFMIGNLIEKHRGTWDNRPGQLGIITRILLGMGGVGGYCYIQLIDEAGIRSAPEYTSLDSIRRVEG